MKDQTRGKLNMSTEESHFPRNKNVKQFTLADMEKASTLNMASQPNSNSVQNSNHEIPVAQRVKSANLNNMSQFKPLQHNTFA